MTYYVLRIEDIPESGRSLEASSSKDSWLDHVVKNAISNVKSYQATLAAKISKIGRSLEITGGVYIKLNVDCDSCLTPFVKEQQVPFRLILEPRPTSVDKDDEEDINDSVDFSYYDGDGVDVGDLIRQHIVMAQPMRFVCSEDCRGLCPKCGQNLNQKLCSCKDELPTSPFSVLKDLKR